MPEFPAWMQAGIQAELLAGKDWVEYHLPTFSWPQLDRQVRGTSHFKELPISDTDPFRRRIPPRRSVQARMPL